MNTFSFLVKKKKKKGKYQVVANLTSNHRSPFPSYIITEEMRIQEYAIFFFFINVT